MIKINEKYYKPKGNKVLIANSREYYGNYPFQPETKAILKSAEELQYATPSFYQRVFIDLKIKAMKLSGVWDKFDVYYNFGYNKPLLDDNIKFVASVWGTGRLARVWDSNTINPFGYRGANKTLPTEETFQHRITNAGRYVNIEIDTPVTVSCYVKPDEYKYIKVANVPMVSDGVQGFYYATFNLETMEITDISSGSNAKIEKASYGWFRVSLTAHAVAGLFRMSVIVLDDNKQENFAGNNVDGIYMWGTQIDYGVEPKSFNPVLDEFSLIDWKNPGRVANRFGGMFFTLGGWIGNGLNGYIDTNFNPLVHGVNYTLNNASRISVFYYDAGSSNTVNVIDGVNINGILNSSRLQVGTQYFINQANFNNTPSVGIDLTGTGLKAIVRKSENDLLAVNKSLSVSSTQPSSLMPNTNQFVLRRGGGGGTAYGASGISVYALGASLSYEQTQQLRTIENNWFRLNNLPEIA